jgi:hypothetical protein
VNTTYGIGGALQSLGGNMMSMAFSNMQDKKLEERKRQAEEAARLLEESRVARTSKPFRTQADPNAQSPWVSKEASGYVTPQGKPSMEMVEEFNSSGRPIGTRPASASESVSLRQEEEALKAQAQEKARLRGREEEEFGMKKEKHKSSLERDKASIASSRASAAYLRSGGSSGRPKAQDEAVLWKDINNLMSDPNYRAAVEAGDASVLREFQPEDSVVKGLRSVAEMAGVPVPGNSGPSILEELQAEQDPVVRAQMLAGFKRRLEQAAARGLSAGKGVKPQKQ